MLTLQKYLSEFDLLVNTSRHENGSLRRFDNLGCLNLLYKYKKQTDSDRSREIQQPYQNEEQTARASVTIPYIHGLSQSIGRY